MEDLEIPHHFICPISLQIMKDPVIVATGITYDRQAIQRWQKQNKTCPVTNQLLPIGAGLTPNHNLRRLIQSWRLSGQTPPSKPPSFHKEFAGNLLRDLESPEFHLGAIRKLEDLAKESESNRTLLKEVGVVRAVVRVLTSCCKNDTIVGLKEALNVLYLLGFPPILEDHDQIIASLKWVFDLDVYNRHTYEEIAIKSHAIVLLNDLIKNANSHVLERLNANFFDTIALILRQRKPETKAALHLMLSACTWRRNCSMMVELGAVFELLELELAAPEKAITEMVMGVLFHLCSSADGRAGVVGHAGGLAVITKRIGKVSLKVDERALMIISLISRFCGTHGVLQEMVRVGTVEKLIMVIQVNCRHSCTRDKAREILKRHSNVWKDSPCLDLTLLPRYPR